MKKVDLLQENINRYFLGKEPVVEDILVCLLAGGHILLEDVPGLGKTTLANIISKSIQCTFGRIQCTSDTLPGDIMGVSVYNQKSGQFEYSPGVVMHQLILVDEINRATPKTQASLLEAMAEGQVTVDGIIHRLDDFFMVIATENPAEFIGTYPLPEASVDRFMMCLSLGYPDKEQEIRIAKQMLSGQTVNAVSAICTTEDVLHMREEVQKVQVSDAVLSYIVDLIRITREEERFVLGASPRAMLALVRASQAKAYLCGRDFVKPDDVKAVAAQVLVHRFSLTSKAKAQKENVNHIFKSLLLKVRIPV